MDTRETERLRLERLRQRMTQVELFAKTGLSPSRISQFERNQLEPRADELLLWRSALGLNEQPTR